MKGVSVKGGAEAAVHAVRIFITNNVDSNDYEIILKLEKKNAFNSVRHDYVMQTCLDRTPEIAKLSFLAYSKPSSVIASGHSISSSTGVQQGDPICPLMIALAVDQIASGVESELNVWYLDDAKIGGSPESVLSDVCITGLRRIGLIVSPKKTEIINVGPAAGKFSRVVNSLNELLQEIKVTDLTKMELLGFPIMNDATRCCIVRKLSGYKRMNDRILLLDGHPGLLLLKKAFSLPRLLLTLRSAPCHHHPAENDVITRSTSEASRTFIFTTTVGHRPNCPFGTVALNSVQLQISHSPPFCPHTRRVSVWLTTSSVSQRTNKRTTMRFGLGWTKISSFLPTLISKEIWTIFSALQPSPPWFPYSTSIVWHISRRLRILSRASGLTASLSTESELSSTTTLSVSASISTSDSLSVLLIDANVERRWAHSVRTLCRTASAQGAFHHERRRPTWSICSRDIVHARTVWS